MTPWMCPGTLLDAYGENIRYVRPQSGMFLMLDLTAFLRSNIDGDGKSTTTFDNEFALWQNVLDNTRVNLTPGSAMHCQYGNSLNIGCTSLRLCRLKNHRLSANECTSANTQFLFLGYDIPPYYCMTPMRCHSYSTCPVSRWCSEHRPI